MARIEGSIVALVTPMLNDKDQSVDWQALESLINWHVDAGTAGIIAVGTTGESATIDFDEHAEVIARMVKMSQGRIAIIAGTGANATKEATMLTHMAKEAGADAGLSVVPYYNKPTQEGLYQHYMNIADASDLPLWLYNVPGRTVADLSNETVLRLAKHPNIVALKDATGDLSRADGLIGHVPEDFALYSGDDLTACEFILKGGQGNVSVTANVVPDQMAALCRFALAGESESALAVHEKLVNLSDKLFCEANPIPVKWALHAMGKVTQSIRLPLTPLSEPLRADLLEAISALGVAVND